MLKTVSIPDAEAFTFEPIRETGGIKIRVLIGLVDAHNPSNVIIAKILESGENMDTFMTSL